MAKTLRTGLQFMGASTVTFVTAIVCWLPIKEKIKHGTASDLEASLFYASGLFGFIALALGLVASIYLISAVIEGIGRLLWKRKVGADAECGT
jgi:hypothetical protein